jgi:uncharacterized membrane protein YdjX (TVP38/TMEM64 family)
MKKFAKRYLLLLLILHVLFLIYLFDLDRLLTFEGLKAHHEQIELLLREHPFTIPFLYIFTYIVLAALSLPGMIVMNVLGGYLFVWPLGIIYTLFAATIGASILFLATRLAFGNVLKQSGKPFIKKMERGFRDDAVSYMLFLRLVPIFPFWIVNAVPAFFRISLKTFIWTTSLGLLPEVFICTLAGRGLEKFFINNTAFSIRAIFNPQVKISLILLGVLALFPVFIKKFRKYYR